MTSESNVTLAIAVSNADLDAEEQERLVARHSLGNKTIELEVEANGKKPKVKASSREELAAVIEQAQKFVAGN